MEGCSYWMGFWVILIKSILNPNRIHFYGRWWKSRRGNPLDQELSMGWSAIRIKYIWLLGLNHLLILLTKYMFMILLLASGRNLILKEHNSLPYKHLDVYWSKTKILKSLQYADIMAFFVNQLMQFIATTSCRMRFQCFMNIQ